MTTQTLTSVIIAALLAGSAAGGVQVTGASLASAPDRSANALAAGCGPSGAAPYFLVLPAGERVAASAAGLKPASTRTVRLIP